ncbi:gp53-like domain-containing protein [Klebsiella quasipneumoniae]
MIESINVNKRTLSSSIVSNRNRRQWLDAYNSPSGNVQYPIPFPKRAIAIVATKYADGNRYVSVTNDSNSGFGAYGWISGSSGNADNFGWLAIGE